METYTLLLWGGGPCIGYFTYEEHCELLVIV